MSLPTDTRAACELCAPAAAGTALAQGPRWRVVSAGEPAFPGFYRLVWQAHVAEFSELSREDRQHCLEAVTAIESAMRAHLQPTKINLASLGNVVPHLHWHVIARYDWDSHFPAPVWAEPRRPLDAGRLAAVRERLPAFEQALVQALTGLLTA
jgi:diadenosine tetraphosphate (Ap4A) HIT family hydrolase